ncbi:putative Endonuclease III [Leptomonas pyrrhocoris]|uniref:Putative Endonuclease III n=1 Tax=Leptomonas pyrrhocoris TaxID=157538 RepID=A0A0N0VE94_LEPPY|nr:putative Endonuclease III [Leptomonas pyrrhocoris]KPA77424.1 putative Endonuclease III [Leptomonas pyrrhocoris]|eukprot:XP_015655863.1 putative Endonuclease III [Leptomonas pyrrhocoris]
MLVGLMLSALARETTCAPVMNSLIQDGLTPQKVQSMGEEKLRERIKTVNLCNNKAKHIAQTAGIILRDYDGKVPRKYEELIALPGVGPKMANLFFSVADNRLVGIGVDTHVHRVSQRLGWVPPTAKTPEDTRKCLESWLPREHWADLDFDFVTLGQDFCRAKYPKCEVFCVQDLCPHGQRLKKPYVVGCLVCAV